MTYSQQLPFPRYLLPSLRESAAMNETETAIPLSLLALNITPEVVVGKRQREMKEKCGVDIFILLEWIIVQKRIGEMINIQSTSTLKARIFYSYVIPSIISIHFNSLNYLIIPIHLFTQSLNHFNSLQFIQSLIHQSERCQSFTV